MGNLLFCILYKEFIQFLQSTGGNFTQQSGKLILPFCTVCKDGILEWGTIQQYKLYVQDTFLRLYIIGNFCVSVWEKITLSLSVEIHVNVCPVSPNILKNINPFPRNDTF